MATPVPIPNTAVKHLSADNTWLETARESRSLPDLYQSLKLIAWGFVFFIMNVTSESPFTLSVKVYIAIKVTGNIKYIK